MPHLPDVATVELTPDWVCEITSPSTAGRDRVAKLRVYRRHGVEWLWYADPEYRIVEVFHFDRGNYTLAASHEGDGAVALPPFAAVELLMGKVW